MSEPAAMTYDLNQLLAAAGLSWSSGLPLRVRGVAYDSRRVAPGDLFVAIPGLTVDGQQFAAQAVQAGASAVICQSPLELQREGQPVPCIVAQDARRALGLISARLCGDPSRELVMCGITGTNGKSTTAFLLREMLRAAGGRCGLLGTIVYDDGEVQVPAPFTTPTAPELQHWLQKMVAAGCSHGVMEVSSHGLELGRTWGCEFAVAAFSNLTQDHLDLHGDMERYLQAKLLLFERHLRSGGTAVVNADGAYAERVIAQVRRQGAPLLCCSSSAADAHVRLLDTHYGLDGTRGTLAIGQQRYPLRSPLVGAFNGENLLLAAGCAHALGVAAEAIVEGASRLLGIPGRLERIPTKLPFEVFVDYAHTPDALGRALDVLRPLCPGRLLVLFGCGGDRDRGKRPLMGQAAARRADLVVLSSDNPRSEDPRQILAEIEPGVAGTLPRIDTSSGRDAVARGYWVEPDRAAAIADCIGALRPSDVLLIAGKGHEDYQLIGAQRLSFDDRLQARAALGAREVRDG